MVIREREKGLVFQDLIEEKIFEDRSAEIWDIIKNQEIRLINFRKTKRFIIRFCFM
jgi:hypothetical protein